MEAAEGKPMQLAPYATMSFDAQRHPARVHVATCGLGSSALVTKRTRIWPGGLSAAGGKLP
jgi:hypothetical protein